MQFLQKESLTFDMNFFKKNNDDDKKPAQEAQPVPRQEWVRQEAVWERKQQGLMTPQQLQRTREAKRLAETKMAIMEESVQRLREQQEWLRRHTNLCAQLQEEKATLHTLLKQQSTMAEEARNLERYESFEEVQGDFQRMTVLGTIAADNRRSQNGLERTVEELQHGWEDQHKQVKQRAADLETATSRLQEAQDPIAQAHHIAGQQAILAEWAATMDSNIRQLKDAMAALRKKMDEQAEENELNAHELDRHRAGRQSIEMHERMIVHSDGLLARLDRLALAEETLRQRTASHKERQMRQNELNERLGTLFGQFQDVNAQLSTLGDELAVHRNAIKGKTSYQLQENTMRLKSRGEMLRSALSLWNRIWTGYDTIEEKRQQLNQIRLRVDHLQGTIGPLADETDKLERLCSEKLYTYLMSKSQNVIRLRGDLKEGVSCSVCGATHHPYHSDTMLEQSKLIGEFKTEHEMMEAELKQKKALLHDLRMELSEVQGQRKAEENSLATSLRRQEEDVKEWQLFCALDSSFKDCSPSTNREARQAMLRQLIENTAKDAQEAQERLDRYNYRQTCISELSEKIMKLEQRKNELSTALNELNTSCQVMAGQVDLVQGLLENVKKSFQQIYGEIDSMMTLPDWFNEWNRNHESLRMHIMKLADSWQVINHNIDSTRTDLLCGQEKLATMKEHMHAMDERLEVLLTQAKNLETRRAELDKQLGQLLGGQEAKAATRQLLAGLVEAQRQHDKEMDQLRQMQHNMDAARGQLEAYVALGNAVSDEHAGQQQKLDLWIHNYNAQHPPVQYSELERLFQKGKGWNAIRQRLARLHGDMQMHQARMDQLQAELTVMQTEAGRVSAATDEKTMDSLVIQRQEAEKKLHDLVMQIARLQIAIDDHEKASIGEE